MKMKISTRDKRLLFGLVIILILVLPYFFVIRPLSRKTESLNTEVDALESRYHKLSEMNVNRAKYEEKTQEYIADKKAVIELFPAAIDQEAIIQFIVQTEENTKITMSNVGFTNNASAQITTDSTLESGLTAVSTSTMLSYACSYEELIPFLTYISGYKDRMVITDINFAYDNTENIVSGTLTLVQYAIQSADREIPETVIPNAQTGTDNIFVNNSAPVGREEGIDVDYDFFLQLSNPEASVMEKIIGKAYDATQDTYVMSSENKKEQVKVTVEGKNGLYTIQYSIGDKMSDRLIYEPGESMDFMIISSARVGNADYVTAEITWVNNSDMDLNVYITNEDEMNPRAIQKGITGVVNFM